ncbi:hypothetical protein C900_03261 [Fulvivirga imtechensis AK7]|uniref:DUF4265 domain-containing protein n=1 Tax=Fulvivirga imtechensis AK7 TaxID=1237149 RepID=L8JPF2_9BACT|nr:DUF4265 domain-containing protein [Fulvivirga imtechensis]ELR70826.1 hypothetical protein C900_03261 [Fulvivirga imtechensis AK7]
MRSKSLDHQKLCFRYFNEDTNAHEIEMLWCIKSGNHYIVDNIPVYVPSVAFKDVVEGRKVNGELFATQILEVSGNSTVRVLFKNKALIGGTIDKMRLLGCDSEISNIPHLVAFNIPKEIDYFNLVQPYLQEGENKGKWEYEESCLAHDQIKG